jgi:hypothetical protein
LKCTVVNLRTSAYDVYIGRAGFRLDGYFGNPFSVEEYGREGCLAKYREYFRDRVSADLEFQQRVLALAGKRLGCFCVPKACHGHIIADYVNKYGQKVLVQGKLF